MFVWWGGAFQSCMMMLGKGVRKGGAESEFMRAVCMKHLLRTADGGYGWRWVRGRLIYLAIPVVLIVSCILPTLFLLLNAPVLCSALSNAALEANSTAALAAFCVALMQLDTRPGVLAVAASAMPVGRLGRGFVKVGEGLHSLLIKKKRSCSHWHSRRAVTTRD